MDTFRLSGRHRFGIAIGVISALFCLVVLGVRRAFAASDKPAETGRVVRDLPGWPLVFEFDAGQEMRVVRQGPAGETARTVRLVAVREFYQPDYWIPSNETRKTLSYAEVDVDVSGVQKTLVLRPFQSPTVVNGLRLYVEATHNWATQCTFDALRDVARAVRLSATGADETWGPPMAFPLRGYRWRSSNYYNTWGALVPYNQQLYYHRGEDFGALPQRFDVVSGFSGTVARSPLSRTPRGANTLAIQTDSGLYARYLHMNTESIPPGVVDDTPVAKGQRIGRNGRF